MFPYEHMTCTMTVRPHTHKRETCRKRNIVFLDEVLVRLVENLVKLSLHTHCQDKISSFTNAVTYNTYDGTIKGKFYSIGTSHGAAFANLMLLRVSKSLVRDDSHFSVCYSVTNVLSPLRTLLLPKVRSRLILYSEHARVSMHTHERVSRRKPNQQETQGN